MPVPQHMPAACRSTRAGHCVHMEFLMSLLYLVFRTGRKKPCYIEYLDMLKLRSILAEAQSCRWRRDLYIYVEELHIVPTLPLWYTRIISLIWMILMQKTALL